MDTTEQALQRADAGVHPQAMKRTRRGVAAMDPQRQKQIASLGGRAAHQSGHAHEFTSDEARAAGRKRHERGAPAAS